jgi:hypothetical protein
VDLVNPLILLALAGLGAWALSRKSMPGPPPPPPRPGEPGAPSAPASSWVVSPVPEASTPEAAKKREDGITAVVAAAGKASQKLLIAFPLRRATSPGTPALPGGAEVLAYGIAQRIAQEGDARAYYVKTTSYGRLVGSTAAELDAPVSDLPAVGSEYRITNEHLASIQPIEDLSDPEPAAKATETYAAPTEPPAPEPEPPAPEPVAKKTPVPESRRFFPAAHQSGARDPSRIRVIVLHSTEGGSAAGAASWFQNEASGGSTQLVAGEDGLFRSVDDLRIPWGAQGANSDGLHIELAGYAKWSRDQWLAKNKTLENAASAIGKWSKQYGIPLRYIEGAELADDVTRGVTTHVAVVKAYRKGDHWDPGPGFPIDVLLERAKAYT